MTARALFAIACAALCSCDSSALPGPGGGAPPDLAAVIDLAVPPGVDLAVPPGVDLAAPPTVDLAAPHSCAPTGMCLHGQQCGLGSEGTILCCPRGDWCDTSVVPSVCRCGENVDNVWGDDCVCQGTNVQVPGSCGTGPSSGCP
jgi:hypothetical protein